MLSGSTTPAGPVACCPRQCGAGRMAYCWVRGLKRWRSDASAAAGLLACAEGQGQDQQQLDDVEFDRPKELHDGPDSLEKMFSWAGEMTNQLPASANENLRRNLCHADGFVVSTHCSGMGSLEQICKTLANHMNEKPLPQLVANSQGKIRLCFTHACDMEKSRLKVLLNLAAGGPIHLHGKMEERLPATVRAELEELMPPPRKTNLSHEEKAERAATYMQIGKLLKVHYATNGAAGSSWCYRHHRRCQLFAGRNDKRIPETAFELHGAGTSCKDESRFGLKLQEAGPSQVAFYLWLYERKSRQEAFVVHENTVEFNPALIALELAATHHIYTMTVNPSDFGYPMRRPRRVTACVRKDFVLTMPLEQILVTLGQRVVVNPGVYFCLDAPGLEKYMLAEKAAMVSKSQQRRLFSGGATNAPWAQYMLPSQRERLKIFTDDIGPKMVTEKKLEGDWTASTIVDLDQNPNKRLRMTRDKAGELLSCNISHGFLWHLGLQRPLTSFEALLSQGTAVVPEVTKQPEAWPCLLLLEKGSILQSDMMSIAGNSWHIPTIGKVVGFILASMRPVDWALPQSLGAFVYDNDKEEELI